MLDRLGTPFVYLKSVAEAALHNPNMIVHTVGAVMTIPRIEATHGDYCMYHEAFTPSVWNLLEALDGEKMRVLEHLGCLQYRHVEKKLLVEEYIGSADGTLPEDYKFYCFHGRADCVMLCVGRDEGWPKFYFFDRDFRLLRINRDSQAAPEGFTLPKPAGLDEAFAIADRLSKPFDFVRVDLYLTPRGVRFGELTFTPAAALDNKRLPETDLRFGRMMEETL